MNDPVNLQLLQTAMHYSSSGSAAEVNIENEISFSLPRNIALVSFLKFLTNLKEKKKSKGWTQHVKGNYYYCYLNGMLISRIRPECQQQYLIEHIAE